MTYPVMDFMQTPLNKYTFKSKKIRRWVENVSEGLVLNLFAGETKLSIDEVRNDIRETMNAEYHLDALEFVDSWKGEKFNTIILDPPYSLRKGMEMYDGKMTSKFNLLKDRIIDVLDCNGIVITFGYHSIVMGRKRGFGLERILLMSHGGAIHDTIATVERLNGIG